MGQEILTAAQQTALRAVAATPDLRHFYLSGGTALAAYHLWHRFSDDLDFFTAGDADAMFLRAFAEKLKTALGATAARFQRLYDRNQFFFRLRADAPEELKIEFTRYPFPQFEEPSLHDGVRIDGLRDIAANKLAALLDRFEPKDFVDFYFLLRRFTLADIRRDAEKKFGTAIDPIALGGELMKAKRIAALPRMVEPLTIEELTNFYVAQARETGRAVFSE